jgi:hypothetical protein
MDRAKMFLGGVLVAFGALGNSEALAQFGVNPWYHPYGYGYGAGFGGGTAEGNALAGMSTVIRSAGEYNLMSSAAGVNFEEARGKYLDNRAKWTQQYFQMRETRSAIDAQRKEAARQSREAQYAAAKATPPRPEWPVGLDPVTGHISWPEPLMADEFAGPRKQLDQLFELRAKTSQASATTLKIRAATEELSKTLRSQVQKIPANEYMAARKFIDELDRTVRERAM